MIKDLLSVVNATLLPNFINQKQLSGLCSNLNIQKTAGLVEQGSYGYKILCYTNELLGVYNNYVNCEDI
jgi:hypothetical protein